MSSELQYRAAVNSNAVNYWTLNIIRTGCSKSNVTRIYFNYTKTNLDNKVGLIQNEIINLEDYST